MQLRVCLPLPPPHAPEQLPQPVQPPLTGQTVLFVQALPQLSVPAPPPQAPEQEPFDVQLGGEQAVLFVQALPQLSVPAPPPQAPEHDPFGVQQGANGQLCPAVFCDGLQQLFEQLVVTLPVPHDPEQPVTFHVPLYPLQVCPDAGLVFGSQHVPFEQLGALTVPLHEDEQLPADQLPVYGLHDDPFVVPFEHPSGFEHVAPLHVCDPHWQLPPVHVPCTPHVWFAQLPVSVPSA